MNTIRRRHLVAATLPLLFAAGSVRHVQAKSGEPLEATACAASGNSADCVTGKGVGGGCPHCLAAGKGGRFPGATTKGG